MVSMSPASFSAAPLAYLSLYPVSASTGNKCIALPQSNQFCGGQNPICRVVQFDFKCPG